jgi:hypothetical protein
MEIYDKSQVERHINLDDKISIILPSILEVKTPKGTAVWQEYIQLKKLRDRIIHMKSDDRKSTGPEENTIWHELFKPIVPHRVAKDIITKVTASPSSSFNSFNAPLMIALKTCQRRAA